MSSSQYNWLGVMEFLQIQQHKAFLRENQYLLQKRLLEEKVAELEGKLKAAEEGNFILLKRNRMLEVSIRQLKRGQSRQQEEEGSPVPVPKRKPRSNREVFQKALLSLGMKDLLVDESLSLDQLSQKLRQRTEDRPPDGAKLKKICALKGHSQSVKDIGFCSAKDSIVTVSEDRTVRIWDVKKARAGEDFTSAVTLKEFYGPVLTVCVPNSEDQLGSCFLAAGVEGLVKAFSIGEAAESKRMFLGEFSTSDGVSNSVYHLVYKSGQVLAVLSDGKIGCYQLTTKSMQGRLVEVAGKSKCFYSLNEGEQPEVPSHILLLREGTLAAGFMHSNSLVVFDRQTKKLVSKVEVRSQSPQSYINRICQLDGLLATAHEDKCIRLFDPNSSKFIRTIPAHQDAVSALAGGRQELYSGSHDGVVKVWCSRTWEERQSLCAHARSYSESVTGMVSFYEGSALATSGADSHAVYFRKQ